jgi:hypothetical protein
MAKGSTTTGRSNIDKVLVSDRRVGGPTPDGGVGSNHNLSGGGGGTVTGPSSSTDNALVRWNGVGGTKIKDSNVTLADAGTAIVFSVAGGVTATGTAADVTLTPGGVGRVMVGGAGGGQVAKIIDAVMWGGYYRS